MIDHRADEALLSCAEMYAADAAAMAMGVDGITLMENAGRAVADAICLRWGRRPVAVLCGPGNNGGDGFVAARHLAARGWQVSLHLLGDRSALRGDAAHHAALWSGEVRPLRETSGEGAEMVIDAVFGAGLSRPVDGLAAAALAAIPAHAPIVAVDVPSGVSGDTGLVQGYARPAALTVTFFRGKPGHHLMPGKALIGELVVADIGIRPEVLDDIRPSLRRNGPPAWGDARPRLMRGGHKFDRGHLTVVAGAALTGATRLAARAAVHAGAGLVTVLAPRGSVGPFRADLAALMAVEFDDTAALAAWFDDQRRNAVVIGPGLGRSREARTQVATVLARSRAAVVDGDGLSNFGGEADVLAAAITGPCVLTPHAGEFARLFGSDGGTGRLAEALAAARRMGAVIVSKGPDTVIAAPDGRAAINDGAPPELAVAGSGDVLSGIIGAALAMGMPAFEAAALSVDAHGRAGHRMTRVSADALADALDPLWRRRCS